MLRAYMQDDITVKYNAGFKWGEPTYEDDVVIKGYVVWKMHLVNNIAGEQVISRGIVYVMPTKVITHIDKIEIESIGYAIIDITAGKDFSKNHQELHIQ